MIGVIVNSTDLDIVEEFFELFKTPWELYKEDGSYNVVLTTVAPSPRLGTKTVLYYSSDSREEVRGTNAPSAQILDYNGAILPIYGKTLSFPADHGGLLVHRQTGVSAVQREMIEDTHVVHVGYQLFGEIRFLLSVGQPVAFAGTPTLDLHIALLRRLILEAGFPVVEIPPLPYECPMIACLTHDIDHPMLSNHRFDDTALGFLYRSTVGSLVDLLKGRRTLKELSKNLFSAAQLPFVYLGLAKDPWLTFGKYLSIESGLGATYFAIPSSHVAGRRETGSAPKKRAAPYTLDQIKPDLLIAKARGCEIGLHGIDAWLDIAAAKAEKEQISASGLPKPEGVRMHWLYLNASSFAALDEAGFSYDSSFGYNPTIGYRAGTAQVFRPFGAKHLLELPLHIMDTAMFYPSYLHLKRAEAHDKVDAMIENATRHGGVLTFNWHDRSIAPERLWDEFYVETLKKLRAKRAWFPTAAEAVKWFRSRRDARLACSTSVGGELNIRAKSETIEPARPLTIRVYRPRQSESSNQTSEAPPFLDIKLERQVDITLKL